MKIETIEENLGTVSVSLLIKLAEIKQALTIWLDDKRSTSKLEQLGLCEIVRECDYYRKNNQREDFFLSNLLCIAEDWLGSEELEFTQAMAYYFEDNQERLLFLNQMIGLVSQELIKRYKLCGMEYISYPLPEKLAYVYSQIIIDYFDDENFEENYLDFWIITPGREAQNNKEIETAIIDLDRAGVIDWKTVFLFSQEIGFIHGEKEGMLERMKNINKLSLNTYSQYKNETVN